MRTIFHPSNKILAVFLFAYVFISGLLSAIALKSTGEARLILLIINFSLTGLVGLYIVYGFVMMIVDDFNAEHHYETFGGGLKESAKVMSTIFEETNNILTFAFSYFYLVLAYTKNTHFYLFLSLFYGLSLLLRVYLLSLDTSYSKTKDINKYIITSFASFLLGIFMVFIVSYVIFNKGDFTTSVTLLVLSVIFAIYKLVIALISFFVSKKKGNFIKLSLAAVALTFSLFTAFTIHVEILNLYFSDFKTITLYFTGYPFALIICAFSVQMITHGYKIKRKVNEEYLLIKEDKNDREGN